MSNDECLGAGVHGDGIKESEIFYHAMFVVS